MICPKCNHEQGDGGVECTQCGVIFNKVGPSSSQPPPIALQEEAQPGRDKVSLAEWTDDTGIPWGWKIVGIIFFFNATITIIGLAKTGVALPAEMGRLTIDLILGVLLFTGANHAKVWAQIRAILGGIFFCGLAVFLDQYLWAVLQLGFSASILILLADGWDKRWSYAAMLIVGLVYAFLIYDLMLRPGGSKTQLVTMPIFNEQQKTALDFLDRAEQMKQEVERKNAETMRLIQEMEQQDRPPYLDEEGAPSKATIRNWKRRESDLENQLARHRKRVDELNEKIEKLLREGHMYNKKRRIENLKKQRDYVYRQIKQVDDQLFTLREKLY